MNSTFTQNQDSLNLNIKILLIISICIGIILACFLIVGTSCYIYRDCQTQNHNQQMINEYQPIQQEERPAPEIIVIPNGDPYRFRNNTQHYTVPYQDVPTLCS